MLHCVFEVKKWTIYLEYTAAIKKYTMLSIFSTEYCNYKWQEWGVASAGQIYYAREIRLVNPQNKKE